MSGRGATPASISSIRSAREAKSVAGIEALTAQFLHGALDHQSEAAARRRSGAAGRACALRAQHRPGPVPRRRRPIWREADRSASKRDPDRQRQAAGVAAGAGGGAAAALRRALDAGGRGGEAGRQEGEAWRVGLRDGRVLPLSVDNAAAQRKLALYDVVWCAWPRARARPARAELRVRPMVQGAVVVLENKTGRILAMGGGFSYPLSQLNRATQALRQPGSAIKPLTYLAALGKGLQPNTLVLDEPITLPPIGGGRAREQDYWTPKNYDGGSGGTLTLRRALENSRNLVTAHLLDGGIDNEPEASLDRLASSRSRRRSIASACATIRSCSAPSRCG